MNGNKTKNIFQNWEKTFYIKKTNLGLTNKNFILDDKFLLRKSSPETNLFTQRKNEIQVLSLIAEKKINLPVINAFFDIKKNFIYITPYKKNAKNLKELYKTKKNLQKAATLIKKLHQIKWQESSLTKLNMKNNLLNHIKKSKYNYKNIKINKLIQEIIFFLEKFNFNKQVVVSHNDTLMENFLMEKNKKCFLIDYEYCSLNTHYYDIAVFIASSKIMRKRKAFWFWLENFNIYKKDQKEVKKIINFVLYRNLLAWFWGRAMWLKTKDKKYQNLINEKNKEIFFIKKQMEKLN